MSLESYIQQIKEDLRSAVLRETSKEFISEQQEDTFESHIASVESYIYGDQIPISEIVGIEKVIFPPAEKLREDQLASLAEEMEKLLETHNFYADFPAGLPNYHKYEVLRAHWDDKHVKLQTGQMHLEFCDYEPERCPYPKRYCGCKELL